MQTSGASCGCARTLADIAEWNEPRGRISCVAGSPSLGIITSGIAFQHVREAAPEASVLKLGMTYPLPIERMRAFAGERRTAAW